MSKVNETHESSEQKCPKDQNGKNERCHVLRGDIVVRFQDTKDKALISLRKKQMGFLNKNKRLYGGGWQGRSITLTSHFSSITADGRRQWSCTFKILMEKAYEHRSQVKIFSLGKDGLPRWLSGKEHTGQCRRRRRHRFDPWGGKIPWRRAWPPTLVFLPGEAHGQGSLAGHSPWGRIETETLKQLRMQRHVRKDGGISGKRELRKYTIHRTRVKGLLEVVLHETTKMNLRRTRL